MSNKLYLFLLLLAINVTAAAQIVTLKGKVTDAKTGAAVPAASILSGSFGTSADGNGNFVFYVQQSVVEESGITISSIGYQTIHITDFSDNFNVALKPAIQELAEVKIPLGAEFIVQKAFRQVRQNYINKDFTSTGIQSMIHTVRDTFGYQYHYTNIAKVKIYMSAYASPAIVAQVSLMEKKENIKSNPKARKIYFKDSYNLALTHDEVHIGAAVLHGNPDRFIYKLNRKESIGGRRAYVVNFYSKTNDFAGILYIDTASYAFVKMMYTKYNVEIDHAMDLSKVTSVIQYQKYGDKWALDAIQLNSLADDKGYLAERTDGFKVATITTENAVPLPAESLVKPHTEDKDVIPSHPYSAADKKMPATIQKTIDSTFRKIKIPAIADRVH
jgi:hypothetical protein